MQLATTQQQGQLFDYNQIEEAHRAPIQRAADEIRVHFRRAVGAYIKIGKILNDIHRRFPSVEALAAWFEAEFHGSQRMAYNLMALARKFASVEDAVLERIALSALYELAATSTPDAARQNVLQLAEGGHEITKDTARTIIEQAKQVEATAQGSLLSVEPEAGADTEVCLCGHGWDDHDAAADCSKCGCDCYQTERADHSNVETLVEQTETTTTVEILPPVEPIKQAKQDIGAQLRGEADILFESRKITLQIVIQPQKGDDRDCVLALWDGNEFPMNSLCKWSQIREALTINMPINSLILALKSELLEKKATTKTTTTTTTTKKGKK